jgi:hypothetical protein
LVTLSRWEARPKVAVTSLGPLIVTRHLFSPFTESQPVQVAGALLGPGVAVRVTVALSGKAKLQVAPQLIPAGALVRVPEPGPAFSTVRV